MAVACALALWEAAVRSGALSDTSFPPMTETIAELGRQLGTGAFWTAVGTRCRAGRSASGIAAALAIPLGILIGSSATRLSLRCACVIEFLRPIPSVALIPLAVLIYGTGLESKVFLAAFAAFWPLLVQTLYGVQDVDPVATDTARSFGLGAFAAAAARDAARAPCPTSPPACGSAAAVALILAVTAELVIGSRRASGARSTSRARAARSSSCTR